MNKIIKKRSGTKMPQAMQRCKKIQFYLGVFYFKMYLLRATCLISVPLFFQKKEKILAKVETALS